MSTAARRGSIRLVRAPSYDPPFDDEQPEGWWPGDGLQPMLDLPWPPVPSPRPAPPPYPAAAGPDAAGQPPVDPSTATDAANWFVRTSVEILNGYRPVGHFRALASPQDAPAVMVAMTDAIRRLRQVAGGVGTGLVRPRKVRTFAPRPGAIEIAAVIGTGPVPGRGSAGRAAFPRATERAWAFACRLEQRGGRWCCTAAHLL